MAISTERRAAALELVAAGATLARAGLILPGEGNLSARLDRETCLITPSGVDKGRLRTLDLVELRLDREPPYLPASSDAAVHLAIYRHHPEVVVVVHAHPPHLQTLAGRGERPDCQLLVEGPPLLGEVGWVEPSQQPLVQAERVVAAMQRSNALVLSRHGGLTVGRTMRAALQRMLLLERLAELSLARAAP
jgi:L-fuculose-phosphate aldolase